MAKTRYTSEQKAQALQRLRANLGDLALTSREIGIPERTLRDWRHEYRVFRALVPRGDITPSAEGEPVDPPPSIDPRPPLTVAALTAAKAADEFETLRVQLMAQIMQLSADFPDSMESATMRASAISRLLAWVFKLDEIIPAMRPGEYVYRVEFKDPDGSIHPTPPWSRKTFDDPQEVYDPGEE